MTENSQRIAELQRELAANPASRQFYQLGELLRRDGRSGEAAGVLNAGLAHHPRYMAAWVALGRACLENGKADDAVGALEQALALDAQNPVAWRLLGEARLVLGNRLGALDAMTRSLELVPGDSVLQAAVDSLASETAPPVEYSPMPEAAGAPPESALAPEPEVGEPAFEIERSGAGIPAADAFAEPPSPLGDDRTELVPGAGDQAAPSAEATDVFGASAAAGEPFAGAGTGPGAPDAEIFELDRPEVAPAAGFEFEAMARVAPEPVEPPPVPEAAPPRQFEEAAPLPLGIPVALPPALPAGLEAAPPPEPAPAQDERSGADIFAAPVTEQAPALLHALLDTPEMRASGTPSEPPASLTLARLYLQQQAPDDAVRVLEHLLEREPDNAEARDLLALVHDMMMPLPAAPPPLSERERKIAALQRWLASLTLGWERAAR